jgi:hypothetical protein
MHEDSIRSYLGSNGDAIDARLDRLQGKAEELHRLSYYDDAVVNCATAIEITIKYFCVKPIVEGAFLSELWATQLSKWIVDVRPADQRRLLLGILEHWGIDIEAVQLTKGRALWGTVTGHVLPKRQEFVHCGGALGKEDSELALSSLKAMRQEVVGKIGERFGFTLKTTGKWSHIVRETETGERSETRYTARDPFTS